MKKFLILSAALSLSASILPSAQAFGGGSGPLVSTSVIAPALPKQAAPVAPKATVTAKALPAIKTCSDYANTKWSDLGFNWPDSYHFPSVQAACLNLQATHPDVAKTAKPWMWPYLEIANRMGSSKDGCFKVMVGDQKAGTPINQESVGNNLRLSDDATRGEVLAMVLRAAVPLYLGMCTVTPEQLSAATAVVVSSTTEQLDAVKAQIAVLVQQGSLSKDWMTEINLRINTKLELLQKDVSGNQGAISTLTGFAAVIEFHLRETSGFLSQTLCEDGRNTASQTFKNLDGKIQTSYFPCTQSVTQTPVPEVGGGVPEAAPVRACNAPKTSICDCLSTEKVSQIKIKGGTLYYNSGAFNRPVLVTDDGRELQGDNAVKFNAEDNATWDPAKGVVGTDVVNGSKLLITFVDGNFTVSQK